MTAPKKIAPTPDYLAADGMRGEGAKACEGAGRAEDTPEGMAALSMALAAVEAAQERLQAYALATDAPIAGVVEAADALDPARAALAAALTGGSHAP